MRKLKIRNINWKLISLLNLILVLLLSQSAFAGPQSTTYEIKDYTFGAGGNEQSGSDSTSYTLFGTVGELDYSKLNSSNYSLGGGLSYTLKANVPAAPTVTNVSSWYNKLKVTIDNGSNPSDATFLIQVASGSADFTQDTYFIQSDNTLGANQVWQTYTSWGGASGFTLIGLYPGTTYYVRVAAERGNFTQSEYSAGGSAATINPTLTLSLRTTSQPSPPFTVSIGNLTAGAVTTSPDTIDITISTNATNGGLIYLFGTNNGLKSTTAGNYNITSSSTDLTSVLEGYGARGTTVTQTSGGPMQLISPYNGSSQNVGIIDTAKRTLADSTSSPVINGQVSFELKAKAKSTTPQASDYSDILTILATGSF